MMNVTANDVACLTGAAGAVQSGDAARAIRLQYAAVENAVGRAVNEMVKFGAMLATVEQCLTDARFAGDGSGISLKSWLSESCPEVNYYRAMSYLQAARGVAKLTHLGDAASVLPYVNGTNACDAVRREDVRVTLENSSLNILRMASWREDVKASAGRRALTAYDRAREAAKMVNEALGELTAVIDGEWLKMLPEESRRDFVRALRDIVARAEEA